MPRYIDADKALKFIKKTNANYHWLLSQYSASWVYDFIESQPFADVVPRAEVERLQTEAIKKFAERLENSLLKQLTSATLEKKETICFCLDEIDNLANEMTGGADDER